MIEFQELRYKNFLSTGNAENIIQLNKDKLTLITSDKNGQGKCVHPDTKINIAFKSAEAQEAFMNFLEAKSK